LNPTVVQPGETGPKVGPASSNWRELDRLPGLVRLHLLHFGVKVQNVDQARLLAGKYGANLCLEEPKESVIDRARAIDGDTDLTDTFTDNAWKVKTCPDVATVGAGAAIVRWNRLRPCAPQQLAPVQVRSLGRLDSALCACWHLARQTRYVLSLLNRHLPVTSVLLNSLFSIADWFRRIEHLPDAAWRLRCARRVVILITGPPFED
jgi:hypothetical protein